MPIRDSFNRLRKYEAKLNPEIIGKQFILAKERMVEQMTEYCKEIYEIEVQTRTVLQEDDIPVSLFPSYLCYARELWRLHKNYAGKPLFREIRISETKWQSMGLDPQILEKIRLALFGTILPV